jgi:Raf kinase inhibitor-like YbhB/YbcL family protein
MRTFMTSIVLVAAAATSVAAGPARHSKVAPKAKAAKQELVVTSSAFRNTEAIPHDYTCQGTAQPPPLAWSYVPNGTRSFAILVEDKDAPKGTFTHWLVTDLPPDVTKVEPGSPLPHEAQIATDYTAPCPPSGQHHYIFHVYALDSTLSKPASRAEFLASIRGHVIAQGQVIGTYRKTK